MKEIFALKMAIDELERFLESGGSFSDDSIRKIDMALGAIHLIIATEKRRRIEAAPPLPRKAPRKEKGISID